MCKILHIYTYAHIIVNKRQLQNLHAYRTHFACVQMHIHTFVHIFITFCKQTPVAKPANTSYTLCMYVDEQNFAYSHFCTHFHNFLETNSGCNTCMHIAHIWHVWDVQNLDICTFGTCADMQNFRHLHFCTHFGTQLQKENGHTCMHIDHISHVCEHSKFHT